MQRDILGAMPRDSGQTHPLEQAPQGGRVRCGIFDEFKAVRAHRIGAAGLAGIHIRAHGDSVAFRGELIAVLNT